MTYQRVCNTCNTTGATNGAETAYPSGAAKFTPIMLHELVGFVLFILSNYISSSFQFRVVPISIGPKQLPNCLKQASFSKVTSALILLLFLSVAQQESGTRKAIFWSVTVYNKNVSNQCSLTAQIEPVQDKCYFKVISIHILSKSFQCCDFLRFLK